MCVCVCFRTLPEYSIVLYYMYRNRECVYMVANNTVIKRKCEQTKERKYAEDVERVRKKETVSATLCV